jgi:hypothetical protein
MALLRLLVLVTAMLLIDQLTAQNLREQLLQCPIIIENGKINYYMPQQNGAFFQLPPARKPQYVVMFTVPWVQPLTQSVNETQKQLLSELQEQSKNSNLSANDKSLLLRKLAWCVMLQTSKAKEIDTEIIDFVKQLSMEKENIVGDQAKLVGRLVEDCNNVRN